MSGFADLPELLLGLARDDEFAARSLLPVEGVADSILGFHAQQAVEKALKAALASRDVEFPHAHDLAGRPRADLSYQGSLSHRPTIIDNTTDHPLALPK